MTLARSPTAHRHTGGVAWVLLVALLTFNPLHGQEPDPSRSEALTRRVSDRVRALEDETARLAGQAKILLGELRQLEPERDVQVENSRKALAASRDAAAALDDTIARLTDLEQRRVGELPGLHAGLVELYKQGRGGYARMLLNARDLKEVGRAVRTVAGLARINQERAEAHKRTLEALAQERAARDRKSQALKAIEASALSARRAAERAVSVRLDLVADVNRRRDLATQLVSELELAQQKLDATVADLQAGRPVEAVSVPITLFRGALAWPVEGQVATAYGSTPADRPGAMPRPGVEVAAAEGAPVLNMYRGVVTYADPFEGYGTLVIVDHGGHYSLYGYLGSSLVQRDQQVEAGAQLGTVGRAPAGPTALYFELRVDGQSVDPVEWLESP